MGGLGDIIGAPRRGERGLAALLAVTYAVDLFGLYLLKPARDTIFLSRLSSADLPLAFMLTALLAVPVSVVYGRASRRWSLTRVHLASFAVVVVVLVSWWPLLQTPSGAASYAFYAWVGVAGGLVTAQFWLLGNAVCDAARAKRVFPLLSLGGIAGAALGGWTTGRVAATTGLDPVALVPAGAAAWAVALVLSAVIVRRWPPATGRTRGEPAPAEAGLRRSLGDLAGSPHLLTIVGLVAVGVMAASFVDFQFKSAAAEAYQEREALLGYLGTFYARMSLLALALQVLLTSRLLRDMGVGGSLLVLPGALLLGSVALLAFPVLPVAAGLRAGEMGLKYSLDKTTRELLYLPVPLGMKRRFKVFIDTIVERAARGLAGLALLACTSLLGLSWRGTVPVSLALLVTWIALAVAMRRRYVASFRDAVARRDMAHDDLRVALRDPGSLAVLEGALGADEPREVAYALTMLRHAGVTEPPDRVAGLLTHPAAAVRQQALALLLQADTPHRKRHAHVLLADPDPEVGRLAAACVHRGGGDDALRQAMIAGDHARASVLEFLAQAPAGDEVQPLLDVDEVVAHLDGGGEGPSRLDLARAAYAGRWWTGSVADLRAAVGDAPALQAVAVAALGRRVDRRHLHDLAGLLDRRDLRAAARRALTAYGPVAIPLLVDVAADHGRDPQVRAAAQRALARIPFQRTVDVLLTRLEDADASLRGELTAVLVRLRERRADLRFPGRAVERLMRREMAEVDRVLTLAAALGDGRGPGADGLLRRRLREVRRERIGRIFDLLALLYDVRDITGAWHRFTGPDAARRADAEEFLENLLAPHHKLMIQGLRRRDDARRAPGRDAALRVLSDHADPWLRCFARWTLEPDARPEVPGAPIRCGGPAAEGDATMLTIEKAILLERVDHFDAVDSERLTVIAAIAEEEVHAAGDVLYRAGDLGDGMYLVVDGEVALTRDGEQVAAVGPRGTFGIWALFEAEPRMLTATASTECRVLRIGRDDFADLMAEDIHVAQSLLKSVARRLRQLAGRTMPGQLSGAD